MRSFLKTNAFTLTVIGCTLAYLTSHRPPMYLADRHLLSRPAPPFSLTLLEGETVKLDDYRGNWLLLNFWATWCVPCRVETPHLDKLSRKLGFSLLSITMEDEAGVRDFLREHPLTHPVALDPGGKVGNLFQVVSYPTLVLVDRDGRIVEISHGIDFLLGWKMRYRMTGSIL